MSSPDDMSAAVQGFAAITLAEWLPGYTSPETGPQQKCTLVAVSDVGRFIDVRMEVLDPYPSAAMDFRVWLEVEEL
ncbi:hypothetical protein [Streptomyces sp. NPDC006638]|uniref:hypothetical protein n=1 Tax=Streptomyces sp. NPDC006638 TaxID=3157183 RepID=UPI0033A66F2E